jgi:hypothetical protein
MKKRVVSATGSATGKATCDAAGRARASGAGRAAGAGVATGAGYSSVRGADAIETVRQEARADALREYSSRGGKSERENAAANRAEVLRLMAEIKTKTPGILKGDLARLIEKEVPIGESQIKKIMRSSKKPSTG